MSARRAWVLLMCLFGFVSSTHSRDITTPEIAALSLSPLCLDYRVTGVCFFLDCGPFGCTVRTSPRISHYLPDAVVSSYQRTGENPWLEMAFLSAVGEALNGLLGVLAGFLVDGGHQTEGRRVQIHATVRFKETDVIGHPLATPLAAVSGVTGIFGEDSTENDIEDPLIEDITLPDGGSLTEALTGFLSGTGGYLCRSEAVSFVPYFQSIVDAIAWRVGLTELFYPASFIPGLREIGNWPLNTWGSVHPRVGFTASPEDPKAAAVMAQRAADIVTRFAQPHVYVYLGGGNCGSGCTPPGPVIENDPENSRWQMLTPIPETSCEVFGVNDTASLLSWADFKQIDDTQDYAWNLWRRYRCCWPQSGVFLFAVEGEGVGVIPAEADL